VICATREIAAFLVAKGRSPVAWNEVLGADLPTQPVVIAWRGNGGEAAHMPDETVTTPQAPTSVDHNRFDGREYNSGPTPWRTSTHSTVDYSVEIRGFMRGDQANVRAESISDAKELEGTVSPRAAALAEVARTSGCRESRWAGSK
jgi:hexosaminidase